MAAQNMGSNDDFLDIYGCSTAGRAHILFPKSWDKGAAMPSEDRRIIFTFDEAYKAIYSLCTQKNIKKPPAGVITKIEKDDKDENVIYIFLKNETEWEGVRKAEYSRDFMAAALMLYCRGCGIPIPRMARKSVVLGKENIILRVEISSE